jgi:ADP-ribose pyrophosphatase
MFEISERTTVFSTPWFSLTAKHIANEDSTAPYYALNGPDYVSVLALTTLREIVLVRQYRPAIEDFSLELPSGTVDKGEAPIETAKRELLEETGYRAGAMELIGELRPDTGRYENRLWCYFTVVESEPIALKYDSGELGLEALTMPLSEFLKTCGTRAGCNHALNLAVVALGLVQGRIS